MALLGVTEEHFSSTHQGSWIEIRASIKAASQSETSAESNKEEPIDFFEVSQLQA